MNSKNQKPIQNVICKVENCRFNDCDGNCTARAIEVESCGENGPMGTLCATFTDEKESDRFE